MAKPIKAEMILHGKTARDFEKRFILNTEIDHTKIDRNEKDLAFYKANKAVR